MYKSNITLLEGDGLHYLTPNIQYILEDVYGTVKQKKHLTDKQFKQFQRVMSVLPYYIAAHKHDIVFKEERLKRSKCIK
jgi:16S rRNA A1518/A1519 N6-dimethyltransferase RsmA/KsgA/DIM1 with predicted DNA glycosylase/AP lyase activity